MGKEIWGQRGFHQDILEVMVMRMITDETKAEANETVDRQKRYRQIVECLKDGNMTAKECAVEMSRRRYIPTSERNFTAPRLTELSKKGIVEPIGKKKCVYTGKTVAVYRLVMDLDAFAEV